MLSDYVGTYGSFKTFCICRLYKIKHAAAKENVVNSAIFNYDEPAAIICAFNAIEK